MNRFTERRGSADSREGAATILDRVTVTGAGGFIGRHLTALLLDKCASCRGVLGPGDPTPDPSGRNAEWVKFDLGEPNMPDDLFADTDTVVHLAGPASVSDSFKNPRVFLETHVLGTQAVVDAALRVGVRRFVYVSSAEVYGRTQARFVRESAPLAPRSPYAAAKAGGEMVVRAAASVDTSTAMSYPAPTFVILRPFLVYGPGMRKGGVVHSVLHQARWKERVGLMDPTPVRDLCFVGDVVESVLAACAAALNDRVSVFNVGSGKGVSIRRLARTALTALGRNATIEVVPETDRPRGADLHRLVADTRLAKRRLGWSARMSLEEGLVATLNGEPELRGGHDDG